MSSASSPFPNSSSSNTSSASSPQEFHYEPNPPNQRNSHRKTNNTTTQPPPDLHHGPSPVPNGEKAPTIQLLETLSLRVSRHLFAHEWDHPDLHDLIAPNMTAHVEHAPEPHARTREQFIAQYRAATEAFPNYAVDYLSLLADVDLDTGVAAVWGHLRVLGHPSTLCRESVTVMYWKFVRGRWVCYRQDGIRGVGNFA